MSLTAVLANPVQGSKQTTLRSYHPISTALQRVDAVSLVIVNRPTPNFLEYGQRAFGEKQDRR